MKLKELDDYFKTILNIELFASVDSSLNGIQVGHLEQEISTCAFAVDACQETIERARQMGADLLFVHHGFFWGRVLSVTGSHYNRIKSLVEGNIALYACHLPLDADPELGNNIVLAKRIELEAIEPFGIYKGRQIGFKGTFSSPQMIDQVLERLGIRREDCLSVFPFGKEQIQSVAIISGGAANEVAEAIELGIDLYITGESNHQIYHTCLEGKINLIAAGHYFTETCGVQAVAKKVEKDLGLKCLFISLPTNL